MPRLIERERSTRPGGRAPKRPDTTSRINTGTSNRTGNKTGDSERLVAGGRDAEVRRRVACVERDPQRRPGSSTRIVRPASQTRELDPLGYAHARDNGRTVLTELPGTIPNRDPADAAHLQRDAVGKLLPAANSEGVRVRGRDRVYPASHINVRGYAIDSQPDWLAEAQERLAREGIPGFGCAGRTIESTIKEARRMVNRDIRLRDILHKPTHVDMSPDEIRAEREASRLLYESRRSTAPGRGAHQ